MSYSVSTAFSNEQVKVEGSFPINLYVINVDQVGWTPLYYAEFTHNITGFAMTTAGVLSTSEVTYYGIPITSSEMKTTIEGDIPEVSISVPNVDRIIEAYIQNYDYLRNCAVYKITTFVKYLPSGTTYTYIGSTPDRNSCIIEAMYIDAVTSNDEVVTFSCKPKFAIHNIVLPRRRFTRECSWTYGDTSCSIDGATKITYPTCDYSLDNCRQRGNSSRFGGFPSIPKGGIWITT